MSRVPRVAFGLPCPWCGRTVGRAGVRSPDYQIFSDGLGWVDYFLFVTHGAPRVLRARALRYEKLKRRKYDGYNFCIAEMSFLLLLCVFLFCFLLQVYNKHEMTLRIFCVSLRCREERYFCYKLKKNEI